MRWHNVIGQKEIELFPGKAGAVLAPGSTIPLNHDVTDASINTFLNSLGPVLSSINPNEANAFVENVSGALEGDTAEINQLINNGAAVSTTVRALDTQVGPVIGNLDQVLTALASRRATSARWSTTCRPWRPPWRRRTPSSTPSSATCPRWRPTWPA